MSSRNYCVGVELTERFAHSGISSNLITYLTGPLGLSKATAAENVNTWTGVTTVLPLLGAFIADSYLGRYRMILISSVLYVLVSLLTPFPSHLTVFVTSLTSWILRYFLGN